MKLLRRWVWAGWERLSRLTMYLLSTVEVSTLKLVTCLVSMQAGQRKSGFGNIQTTGAAEIGSRLRFRPDDPYYRLSERDRDSHRVDETQRLVPCRQTIRPESARFRSWYTASRRKAPP